MLKPVFRHAPPDDLPVVEPVAAVPDALRGAAESAHFAAKPGQLLEPAAVPRRLLAGIGAGARYDLERAGAAVARHWSGIPHVALDARDLSALQAAELLAGFCLGAWRFDRHRKRDDTPRLKRVTVATPHRDAAREAWARAETAVRGTLFARDLVSEPANHLTTKEFARRLRGLTKHGIEVEILGPKRLARDGFGALLAVGSGSAHGPRLAVLRWRGTLDAPPVAFVGKGIVFDTGGISIKPAHGMEAMRADMAGAAACAGAILSLALRNSPAPAVAVLAIAENATGAGSYRPGDVLRTLSGRTVEVVDTDAEGRLVLADALHHALCFKPRAVVDLATLTGAIVSALGTHRAGLFGNDAALMASLAATGEQVGERLWPMPIGESHRVDLASDIADIRQCVPSSRGEGGWAARFIPDASHAAAFLREFAGGVPWAHLDIAGVDTLIRPHALGPAGATGWGVRLLDALVAARFEEEDHHAVPWTAAP
ncbi:leucyl aminopeptidase family protein [Falsiroseomonas sp. HW251]|uniref:leucyl aminopeptidase family protein n=1 Tax=Falsiroseomonas sp. HW251 TaxID=3390998 RepID=UPI003D31E41E